MNTKYSNEELLYSLPDYISDKISDTNLKKAIETRINTDSDFKTEYLALSETLYMFDPKFSEIPSEAYFNNLSVRINEKINKKTQPVSFFEKLGISIKFALPALAVILIIVTVTVYMYSSVEDKISDVTTEKLNDAKSTNQTEQKKPVENNPDLSDIKIDQEKSVNGSVDNKIINVKKSVISDDFTKIDKSVISRDNEPGSGTVKAFANEILAFSNNPDKGNEQSDNSELNDNTDLSESEQEDYMLISGESDEDFLEEDIFELTPEEQMEIVDYLKQS